MKRLFLFFILLFSLLSVTGASYTVETIPNIHRQNKFSYVSNPDGIISAGAVSQIDTLLHQLEQHTSAEVAVVLVESIGNEEIKPFAIRLFEAWGIGKKAKDNGLLILFVADQRKITFETGYGVEGILPDIICKRIQTQNMLPAFKAGNYDKGMIDGVAAVVRRLGSPEAKGELWAEDSGTATESRISEGIILYLLLAAAISVIMLLLVRHSIKTSFDKSAYSKYRALAHYKSILLVLSFFFPAFVLFIYLWVKIKLNRLRNGRHLCEQCGNKMQKLNEQDDDQYLTPGEQTEEQLNSVDYDVWLCGHCGAKQIYPYENQFTSYSVCPNCKAKAYALESDHIIASPTPFSVGTGEKSYRCAACRHRGKSRYSIPMIILPPVNRGGRGGGGFGGGGGFSGGSFGGGRSGGGGATSGW